MRGHDRRSIYSILGRQAVHPFPARMAPGIVAETLTKAKRRVRVLDPMSGSGTVLALARSENHKAFGVDIDPLAVLIGRVWTTPIAQDRARRKAEFVLSRAKRQIRSIRLAQAYPADSTEATRRFVRYWFNAISRKQLAALSKTIARVRDETLRDVLWCAFSRLIISKQSGASMALDLAHSRPHRSLAKVCQRPFDFFLKEAEFVIRNCIARNSVAGPSVQLQQGDARKLPMKAGSIDLVITSPPYLNAIDYMRCSSLA